MLLIFFTPHSDSSLQNESLPDRQFGKLKRKLSTRVPESSGFGKRNLSRRMLQNQTVPQLLAKFLEGWAGPQLSRRPALLEMQGLSQTPKHKTFPPGDQLIGHT